MEKLTHCLICGSQLVQLRRHGAYYCSTACKQRAYRISRGWRYRRLRLSPAQIEQRRQAGYASAEAKARRAVEHAMAVLSRLDNPWDLVPG
jgi:hypothetical protein